MQEKEDQQRLGVNIEYFPVRGFPVSHYPFKGQSSYLQPAVFVKFHDLMPNVAVSVQCRAYAHNLEFDTKTWTGGFHFELFHKKK